MSLEPSRKIGLVATLIFVITPAVYFALNGILIYSAIASALSALTGSQAFGSALLASGIQAALIALTVVSIIGTVLFLVSMHGLSQYYNERGIFTNALYWFLTTLIGSLAIIVAAFASLFWSLTSTISTPNYSSSALPSFFLVLLGIFVAALAVGIVSAVFYKRAFDKLGDKSGVQNFHTAGLLYLIGIILTIVLVGGIIVWVAWILTVISFNSIKPNAAQAPTNVYSAPQAATTYGDLQVKYCQYCGARNVSDAAYCASCGKQLQPNT